jgi:hypothetical protein
LSRGRRSTALLLAIASLSLVALAGSGCGDDDDTEVTLPTISVEDEPQTTATDQLPTKPTETQPQNGGTGTIDPNREDSPKNDKPPDPGSPEEAFENACKQNPAACG